jgi:nucleoside-diphosphate-sugar epimerase
VCEYNKELTILGNIIWANTITTWCKLNEITLGHISSGCIYSGCNPNGDPFNEKDEPNLTFVQNNCSFYGGTKALSEKIVKQWENTYIWRIRLPFEEYDNPRNYITKLIRYDKLLIADNSLSNKKELVTACIQTFTRKVPRGNPVPAGFSNIPDIRNLAAPPMPLPKKTNNSILFMVTGGVKQNNLFLSL